MTTFKTPQDVKFDFYWETLKAYDARAEKFADEAQAFFKQGRKTKEDFILEEGDDIKPYKWGRSQAYLRWEAWQKNGIIMLIILSSLATGTTIRELISAWFFQIQKEPPERFGKERTRRPMYWKSK